MNTVPTFKVSKSTAVIIGRRIRAGFVPGGFWPPIGMSITEYRAIYRQQRRHKEIIEAANVVLEGRQMPRAQEAQS